MKIGKYKDGGIDSHVSGWFIESKRFATAALLHFAPGSREAFHSHAFNCISLILGPGYLEEHFYDGRIRVHRPGKVLRTYRDDLHKVYSHGDVYVLTLRGPWRASWLDVVNDKAYELTHGRRVVAVRRIVNE